MPFPDIQGDSCQHKRAMMCETSRKSFSIPVEMVELETGHTGAWYKVFTMPKQDLKQRYS